MTSIGENMDFEMEEVPANSHPQTLFETSSFCTIHNQSQHPPTSSQALHIPMVSFDNPMVFARGVPHARFPSQISFEPLALHANGSMDSLGLKSFQNGTSFEQNGVHFQAQNNLSMTNPSQRHRQTVRSSTQKRAPKAPTMSAKKWKPSESRIKQLYVYEDKSIKELREIVNKEFGLMANERQYKAKIQQMKLERNVKAKERRTIVQHIQHRKYAVGKESRHVQVRGRKITSEKLSRWMKETVMNHPPLLTCHLSPIPSGISICTNSSPGSPKMISSTFLEYQQLGIGSMSQSDMTSAVIQRLFAHVPKHIIERQEAVAVFSDLQLILGCKQNTPKNPTDDQWNPAVKEDVIRFRNLMNVARRIEVHKEANGAHKTILHFPNRNLETISSRGSHRHAAWMTPYGRVEVSFWTTSNGSHPNITDEDTIESIDKAFAARVAIVPSRTIASSFRVVFDFTSHLDSSAKITYQAMIPNDSEVFRIASGGQVKELIKTLDKGTARLTDRDEEGRSLLNYAIHNACVDMCKFLLDKQADPNAIEISLGGDIGPLHSLEGSNDAEIEDELRNRKTHCYKVMLEAGADISLENHQGLGMWISSFMGAVYFQSIATLEQMVNLGEPFINPKSTFKDFSGVECFPLTVLARTCGYITGDSIQIVDKAILLLKRKADISCRDSNGDTVLHTLLKCPRHHEERSQLIENKFYLSLTEPKQLLMVFITAGADVYATNNDGETPSLVARRYGQEDEWTEALTLCGYDSEEVFAQSDASLPDCTRIPQTSKLSFEEYCRQRQEYLRFKEIFFEEHCRWCGDKFRPEIVSFEEYCPQCGENFRPKEVVLEEYCQQWREQYLLEKASFTRYYQERRESLPLEEVETTDENEESDQDGHNDKCAKGDEHVEIDHEPIELDTENMLWSDWNGENLQGGGCDDNGISIGLEEAGNNWRDDFMEEVDGQGLGDGNGEGNGFEGSNLNFHGPIADDMDIIVEFCNFSNSPDAS